MAKYDRKNLLNPSTEKNAGGILTTLWRKLLVDAGLVDNVDAMILDYINRSYDPESEKKLNSTNLREYIYGEKMTMKTFVLLLVKILKTKKIVFRIEVTMRNGNIASAELPIDSKMLSQTFDNKKT